MNPLRTLLEDNADPCNTRHDMLTGAEVIAIIEALNAEPVIDYMVETYNWRHPK